MLHTGKTAASVPARTPHAWSSDDDLSSNRLHYTALRFFVQS